MNARLLSGISRLDRGVVYDIVKSRVSVSVSDVVFEASRRGVCEDSVLDVIDSLLVSGKVFEPKPGFVEFVDY